MLNSSKELRRRWRGLVLSVLASLTILLVGPAAIAQDAEATIEPFAVRVDTTEAPEAWIFTGSTATPSVDVTVNDQPASGVTVTSAESTDARIRTVLMIANSERDADDLDELKAAAIAYVEDLRPNEEVAVVTAGAAGSLRIGFNANKARTIQAIENISANGRLRMWDGIVIGTDLFDDEVGDGDVASMVVYAAGGDELSGVRPTVAQGGLLNAQALLHVVGIDLRGFDAGPLANAVNSVGGSFRVVGESAEFAAIGEATPDVVNGLHRVRFTSERIEAGGHLDLVVDGTPLALSYVPRAITGRGALERGVTGESSGIGFLGGSRGLLLGLGLGSGAVGLAAFAVFMLFQKDESGLTSMLSAYEEGGVAADVDGETGLQNNAIFQRAVELTEDFAEKRGMLGNVEYKLEHANIPLKAAEALTMYVGIVLMSLALGFVLTRNIFITAAFVAVGIIVPPMVLTFRASRRRKKFVALLPDTLALLAGTLKAGYSFMQGLETVSKESEDPMGEELRKVVTEAQLGLPVEEALDNSAERIESEDYAWAIMAVKIQREVGGNLAELLMTVAETMTARDRLRREVAALTAEGRISAIVLGALPVLLGFAMYVINPEYVGVLIEETLGNIMLGLGVTAALIGFAWMKKIIDIEI